MQALNQAFETAAAFKQFRDELTRINPAELEQEKGPISENRTQRRTRERAERKALMRQSKVRA